MDNADITSMPPRALKYIFFILLCSVCNLFVPVDAKKFDGFQVLPSWPIRIWKE